MFLAVIVVREQFHLSRQFIQNVTFTLSMIRIQYFGFFLLAAFGVLWGFRSRQELETEGADVLVQTPEELERVILGQ